MVLTSCDSHNHTFVSVFQCLYKPAKEINVQFKPVAAVPGGLAVVLQQKAQGPHRDNVSVWIVQTGSNRSILLTEVT